jgi:5-deoxy-glucuronate isomerase
MTRDLLHRRGALAREGWQAVVDHTLPGWTHTGIRIADLTGGQLEIPGGAERIVVPLAGSFVVSRREHEVDSVTMLAGRRSVFDGPTDVLYLSCDATATVSGQGRVAVASSPTTTRHPTRHVRRHEIPVELRGTGAFSRQVHNLGTPEVLDAERLIVCEVITPSGNWSSYPPHKHDEHRAGAESRLEEIYYFEAGVTRGATGAPHPDAAFGTFLAYSSSAGDLDLAARVGTGDIALVPHGYHGPAAAAPGYDLYYLNVMAGPDPERRWLISDDPAHAWVRDAGAAQPVDPRLPYERDPIG